MSISYEPVMPEDFEPLLALRLEALQGSLMRLGRWNPERSRQHFQALFDPAAMQHVVCNGRRVGFIMVCDEADGSGDVFKLRQLYLDAAHRGSGIGSQVLQHIQQQAAAASKPILLEALQQSDANRFYLRHGFVKTGETEWDVMYRWQSPARVTWEAAA